MSKKLTVLKYPHPALRKKCEPVQVFDANLRENSLLMKAAMLREQGVGLAANQVGLTVRMIIVGNRVMVNPVITQRSDETVTLQERCLSFPKQVVSRVRHVAINVEYQTVLGEHRSEYLNGTLAAQVVQHEIEHLDGILLCDDQLREVNDIIDRVEAEVKREARG